MSEEPSHLTISDANGVSVVEFQDRKILEEYSINQIGDRLSDVIERSPDAKMLLSFRNVEHLSSAALGMLIKLNHKIGERNGKLVLSDISAPIFEVFRITRLNKLFDIQDTKEDALAMF